MRIEVAQGMVAAFEQFLRGTATTRNHLFGRRDNRVWPLYSKNLPF